MKSLDMKVALRAAIVAVVSGTCAAAAVNAAEPVQTTPLGSGAQNAPSALQAVVNKNQIRTRGQNVRMSAKMRFALGSMMAMPNARTRMTAADVQSMQAYYKSYPDLKRTVAIADELCADVNQQAAAGVPASFPLAYSIATSLNQIAEENERADLAHFTRQLNSLSAAARPVYDEAMSTITDQNLVSSRLDYIGLAADAPKLLVEMARQGCAQWANPSKEPPIGIQFFSPPSATPNE